jgi:cell division protein FtsB
MRSVQARRQDRRPALYRGWRKALYSWPMVVLLFLIVFALGRSTWRVYRVWGKSREAMAAASAKYAADLKRSKDLEDEVSRLETERGIEEELRRNFPVARPGEEAVVIIVDTKATTSR